MIKKKVYIAKRLGFGRFTDIKRMFRRRRLSGFAYSVGDLVRVKTFDGPKSLPGHWTPEMWFWMGQIVTIAECVENLRDGNEYRVEEDGVRFFWAESDFEPIVNAVLEENLFEI